jgi:purine-binding chemotaxis protein CheW
VNDLHLLVRVAGTEFALPAERVAFLESYEGATAVPGAAPHVAGLVQVRGQVVPLVDLRVLFGLPPIDRGLEARVVVVEGHGRHVGLLVDGGREVIRLDPGRFQPPPAALAEGAAACVDAVAQADGRLVLRMDVDRVIGGEGTLDGDRV